MTRHIMTATTVLLAALGAVCLFTPEILTDALNQPATATLPFQLAAAGALGFAMLNWLARGGVVGGIYGRPLVAGNFVNAGVLTLVLIPEQFREPSAAGVAISVLFLAYWAVFAWLLFHNPAAKRSGGNRPGTS